MSFLSERKCYLPLDGSVAHKVVLKAYTENESKTEDGKPYVVFEFEVLSDGRIIKDTRFYPIGTDILANQLAEQTGHNAMAQDELFNELIKTGQTLNMWVDRVVVDTNFYTNYLFREPVHHAVSTPTTDTSSLLSSVSPFAKKSE